MSASTSAEPTVIRVGHSPDSDDAFMFYALTHDKIDTGGLKFVHQLEDKSQPSRSTPSRTWPTPMLCSHQARPWATNMALKSSPRTLI